MREALLALLERQSFDQITVRGICKEANVHYATFFRHHPTKESLLDAIAREQISRLSQLAMAVRLESDYEHGFRTLCAYVEQRRTLFSTLLNGGAGGAMRQEWVRQAKAVAETVEPANRWLPKDLGTVCSATLIAETLAWWVSTPEGSYSVDHVANIMMRLHTGLTAPD